MPRFKQTVVIHRSETLEVLVDAENMVDARDRIGELNWDSETTVDETTHDMDQIGEPFMVAPSEA